MTNLIKIAQEVATYQFKIPEYEDVIKTFKELLDYLQTHPTSPQDNYHQATKNLYWTLVIKISDFNQFRKDNNN